MDLKHIALAAALTLSATTYAENFTDYVDVKIGSGGHGHVFVGASTPFGMVQLGPTSIPQSWDWCSGYHESDSTVIGFSHTHLEGTGIGDLFDVTVMPVIGDVTYARGTEDNQNSGMWSYADRSKEIARPGYYSVPLTRYGIKAEMTATERVGFHRYTFPKADNAALVIDLENGGCWDRPTETKFVMLDNTHIAGFRRSKGWAKDQFVYFYAELSKPATLEIENQYYARLNFNTAQNEQVLIKVALSPVSIDGAKKNMQSELAGWDFDATSNAALNAWNSELGKITIKTNDSVERTKFYTSLYHTMIVPALFSDVDGKYRGADGKVKDGNGHDSYTIFSLWDTYRAEMPLLNITQTKRYADMINTMVNICDEQGRLPVWHLWGNETDCMVGNPGVIVVADAIVKKVPGVDLKRAYQALLTTAADTSRHYGLRVQYGYIPSDMIEAESIAFDMEYAIADAAIAQAAKVMGDKKNAKLFEERSHSYRNYFDKTTGFARGRMADGSWRSPFDPRSANHRADDYCEGNSWQYTWLAPQDLDGLAKCFGSKKVLEERLDSLFTTSSELVGEDVSPDISGLIGQYAHGNEPSHHIIYFYTMIGKPNKAADRVRQVLKEFYSTEADGLSGNEDAGQMSAWFIMSSLGFYQVEPAGARYWFGSPSFDEATIQVPGGKFTVKAENNSAENNHIISATLNGKKLNRNYITHTELMNGGTLTFKMGK
jgi:predicted alpha-1,2-mannosidase